MDIRSISNPLSPVYSLDEILQDIPETATEVLPDLEDTYHSYKEELNFELKTTDRVWLEFQAGQCEQFGKTAKSILYRIVKSSVNHPENSIAAANAITILKTMRISFSCLDLADVQIPNADLSEAILDGADLSHANLENVNFTHASLNYVKMQGAFLKGIKLGIECVFKHENNVHAAVLRNSLLFTQVIGGAIFIWDIKTGVIKKEFYDTQKKLDLTSTYFFNSDKFFINTSKGIFTIYSIDSLNTCAIIPVHTPDNLIPWKFIIAISPNESSLVIAQQYWEYLSDISKWASRTIIQFFDIHIQNDNHIQVSESKKDIVFGCFIDKMFYSPKGTWLVTIHQKLSQNTFALTFFEPKGFRIIASIPIHFEEQKIKSISYLFSADEKRLFIAVNNTVYSLDLWDDTHQQWNLTNPKKCMQFSEPTSKALELIHFNMKISVLSYKDDISNIYLRNISIPEPNISYFPSKGLLHLHTKPSLSTNGETRYEQISKTSIIIQKIQDSYSEKIKPFLNNAISITFSPNSSEIKVLTQSYDQRILYIYTYTITQNSVYMNILAKSLENPFIQNKNPLLTKNRLDYQEIYLSLNGKQIICKTIHREMDTGLEQYICINMKLWNIDEPYAEHISFDCKAHAIALSDNQRFIAVIQNNQVELWSVDQKEKLCIYSIQYDLTKSESLPTIAISPKFSLENGYIAYAAEATVTLLKLENDNSSMHLTVQAIVKFQGKKRFKYVGEHNRIKPKIQFVKNNQYLVVVDEENIFTWDILNKIQYKTSRDINNATLSFNNQIETPIFLKYGLDVSPDRSFFIQFKQINNHLQHSTEHLTSVLGLYELNTGILLHEQEVTGRLTNVTFSPDSTFFLTWGIQGTLKMWQICNKKFRLYWRAQADIYEEAREIDRHNVSGLSDGNKSVLELTGNWSQ